jgi:hypothetical protein
MQMLGSREANENQGDGTVLKNQGASNTTPADFETFEDDIPF